ncbi:MAG: hypothetical protein ABIS67_15725 [Candidatus Eisenbacteria bacterium]
MKLLSDFDGVWTLPFAEGQAQGDILDRGIVETLPAELREEGVEWVRRARAAVAADPQRFGWAPGGRLSAFGDEDPFMPHSGLVHFAAQAGATDRIANALRDGLAARGKSLDDLGAESHSAGVARVVAERGPAIVPAAREVVRPLQAGGVEVVVASNSGPDKLLAWFAHAGIPGVLHPAHADGALRLRGGARKFLTDETRSVPLALGETRVETARPFYEAILADERPDAVVGDVFSLDLALPLRLKRTEAGWSGVRLFWLIQSYTPAWLRALVEQHAAGDIELVEGGIAALPAALLRSA